MAPEEVSVVTERLPKSQVGMSIEVPAEVVDATYDRVLNRLASRAKIEGFRPGRAPRALVEARVGPAALREEVVETMVPEVVQQALVKESIDPIDNPDVEVLELERGRPAKLKATISVMPELVAVLPGAFTDEKREARVSFPDSHSEPQLAGKDATIRVTVRGVKEKVLPPLDDELAKSLTGGKQETAEAYRQAVREDLEES